MDAIWRTTLWRQFGAAIDMFENAVRGCPDALWHTPLWRDQDGQPEAGAFWYIAYHTLFWLDLYLSGSVEGFAPPAPFTMAELDPAGVLPERTYTQDELQAYLDHGRAKCQATIEALTDEKIHQPCRFSWGEVSFAELLLYNMRHVQEHGAQLNLILGQQIDSRATWVAQARGKQAGE